MDHRDGGRGKMGNLGDYVFDNTLLMKLPHVHCLIPVFPGGCPEISAHHGAVRGPFLHRSFLYRPSTPPG